MKGFRWKRWVFGILLIVVIGALADLLGWNIRGWFKELRDTITTISVEYVVGACLLLIVQTTTTAYAWFSILRYGYPDAGVRWRDVWAAYAASVALNGILPANLGTLMMLLMFTTFIAGATFAGVIGGYAVEKIFYTLIGAFVYLYLFLTVGGSFDIKFNFVHAHPWATVIVIVGGTLLIWWAMRLLWPRVVKWWDQAKQGGRILVHPGAYFGRVFFPSFLSWVAMLGVVAVFLAAYNIPVSFHTLMRVVGGNSIANVTSVTPGGVGVTQAFNVASLKGITVLGERDRVFGRAATGHHGLQHPVRDRADGLGVRLGRRQAARDEVVHRREGEAGRAIGRAQGEEAGEGRREGLRRLAR